MRRWAMAVVVIIGWSMQAEARRSCDSNDECPSLYYCESQPGQCGGPGVCRPRGINLYCVQRVDPVCGCDGKTYDNDCYAMKAGASIDHEGVCDAPPDDGGCDGGW